MFQLTEWVYKVIAKTLSTTPNRPAVEVMESYNKCLDWYSNIFEILNFKGGRTPFALFIQ